MVVVRCGPVVLVVLDVKAWETPLPPPESSVTAAILYTHDENDVETFILFAALMDTLFVVDTVGMAMK